ncbi:MAG: molybdate ABC transporter permease subunit [Gemmatimonadota bacterium]|nr:molybdate ABC transporter permease subunit [Gemmatimonadota bacterium]MDH4347949.1 molybdate ABC transporter permease subunit [Gemmatimonadota bacterium]MDH5284431.1 molybdate ABC transporter permease subunit [Gemmatimonadota bacterium]
MFAEGLDLVPALLSARVAGLSTLAAVTLGTPLAWLLGRYRFTGRALLENVVLLPLVLPPTVVGYYVLVLVSRRGPVGEVLAAAGFDLAFTWRGAVLAAWIGSFGLFVRSAQAGFELVDPTLEDAARTLGRSEWGVFWSVTLPLAWRGIAAGTALAFCRAVGEFGITLMVAGNIPGRTQTIPLAIYDAVQGNRMADANALSLLTLAVVVLLLLLARRGARVRF